MPSLYDEGDAARYDDKYAARFAEAEDAAALIADLADGGPVLELGVGTGRLALPLVGRGLDVHGVDTSPSMVERMRRKPGGDRVRVFMGDFADIGPLVEAAYALVFVAFNTLFALPSQDDQVRCFEGVAGRLRPDGRFLIEAFVPDPARRANDVYATRVAEADVVLTASQVDEATQQVWWQDVTITEGGIDLRGSRIRYATPAELDLMARLAGLTLESRWGGWHREPFTSDCWRHISVYRPAKNER